MRPTLRQFEYAIAVARKRHFRRAAESCHVTQPALSTQIAQLEDTLGVKIFERNRRQVRVTAAGEQLIARMRACLDEVSEIEDLAALLSRPGAGRLRLGVIPTVAPYYLPALLPLLRAEHPNYELQLWEAQTHELLERLDEGELDLLLLALPVGGQTRRALEIGAEPFFLVAPADHPLASRETLSGDDLQGAPLLLLADGHCLREHALAACGLGEHFTSGPMHANSLSMLVQMVRNGMGVTLLPAAAVPVELVDHEGLALRPFRDRAPSRILGLMWREGSARSAELESIADHVASILRGELERALRDL